MRARQAASRPEERDHERAFLHRAFPALSGDAGRHDHRGTRPAGARGAVPDHKSVYYFAGIDEARFKRPVVPGDQLLLEVTVERSARGLWKFGAQARVGDALAAEAKILCTLRPI